MIKANSGSCTTQENSFFGHGVCLHGNMASTRTAMTTEAMLAFRKAHVGRNLSISYLKSPSGPLHMVRGDKQYVCCKLR